MKVRNLIVAFCIICLCCGCGSNKTNVQSAKSDTYIDIPESATNGMWENSYVDIQQENGKYQTKIYLSSVDATEAELIYFTCEVLSDVLDREAESDFYIVLPDNEYKLNLDGEEFSDMGFPKEWTESLKNSDDEWKNLLKSISVDFKNSLDAWAKYSFDKYLDEAIKENEQIQSQETSENEIEEVETEKTDANLIAKGEYKVDGEDLTVVLYENDGNLEFYVHGNVKTEQKAGVMLADFQSYFEKLKMENYTITINFGELFISYMKTKDDLYVFGYNRDGSASLSAPDWFPSELTMSDEEFNDFVKEIDKCFDDFMKNKANLETNTETFQQETDSSNNLLYEDDKVKISFAGIDEKGVVFWLENLTDINITVQADSVAINGISTSNILMSDDVAPKSKGKIIARCDDFSSVGEVETVSGQLRIIDFNDSFRTYSATFTNVEIN